MMQKIMYFVSIMKGKIREYIKIKKSKNITLEVSELFFQHNGKDDFNRYDMIVRLLAVENYFGLNDYGFDLYRKMQEARINKEWVDTAVDNFHSLIRSYAENGYDGNSRITLDKRLHLVDGSHRMAMAMYYGIKYINVTVRPDEYDIFYGIEWFRINGFSETECSILHAKYDELKERYLQPFVCSIWAPAHNYFDEITNALSLFGEISEIRDYNLSEWDYKFYTRGIYHVDDIEKWKIEKKIDYMLKSCPDNHTIRMVAIKLNQPNFRLKVTTGNTLSIQCEIIKKLIRDCYKKKISNYFHDIILHIGDNFYQNRYIYKFMTMPVIDMEKILSHIKDRKYVITKFDVPYMPGDFPKHYALGKDLDIICEGIEEFEFVKSSILNDLACYKDVFVIRQVDKIESKGCVKRSLIRIEQEDEFLVFQFDISSSLFVGDDELLHEIMKSRIQMHQVFVPNIKYELLLRLEESKNYPNKKHHFDFVKNNTNYIDSQLCDKYLNQDWRKVIKI